METQSFYLDSIDGFEFEKACAIIFEKLGYHVENTVDVGDEGRDLTLRTPEGTVIVAECKHWPKGTIGRPVVQKLHSAALTYKADKGMILTTGKYSKQALDYAGKLMDIPIDLIDRAKLADLADRAGISLLSSEDDISIHYSYISHPDTIRNYFAREISNRFASVPRRPQEIVSLHDRNIKFTPAYFISYMVDQDFSTSVGLIHSVYENDGFICINGQQGPLVELDRPPFWQSGRLVTKDELLPVDATVSQAGFTLGTTNVSEIAKQWIVEKHTKTVTYTGRNNQNYTRTCSPSKKNIFLKDIRQVYIAQQTVVCAILDKDYQIRFSENGSKILVENSAISICRICGARVQNKGLLCNSCGNLAHSPRWWKAHSFVCKNCGKTICWQCTYWVPHIILFKRHICEDCANIAEEQTGKPKRKLDKS